MYKCIWFECEQNKSLLNAIEVSHINTRRFLRKDRDLIRKIIIY